MEMGPVAAAAALERIVVGVDGSDAAGSALGWAGRVAEYTGAELVITHAFQPEQKVPPDRCAELKAEIEARLAGAWSAPLDGRAVRHRTRLVTGPPDALLDVADDEDADLLVVGPRGHGAFAALHFGSVAHHLAQHTTRPLVIVPVRGAAAPLDRIVLGVDGSSGSQAPVRWCARLAAGLDAEVFAVGALDPRAIWPPEASAAKAFMEKLRGEWAVPLHDAGVEVHPMFTEGLPFVNALSVVAKDEDAGLFVVGARAAGRSLGKRRGRLPVQLVHQAQIPVTIVPA